MTQSHPFGASALPAGFSPASPAGFSPASLVGSLPYQPAPPAYQPSYQPPQQPAYQAWGSGPLAALQVPPLTGRRRSLPARTPLIAGAVVLALLGAGIFASGVLSHPAAAPAVRRVPTPAVPTPAVAAPAVPAAPSAQPPAPPRAAVKKPVATPMAGTWVQITRANSGTVGASYQIVAPRDYTFERGKLGAPSKDNDHLDVFMTDGGDTQELAMLSYAWEDLPNGALAPRVIKLLRKGWLSTHPGRVALPGTSVATIAGVRATGFDFIQRDKDGTKMHVRVVCFGHGGTLHTAVWFAPVPDFAATLPTFQHIVATMSFTGVSGREQPKTSTT